MTPSATTRSGRDILASRIGRRFIGLFVVCALVPLGAFAWVSLDQVTSQLRQDAERGLHLAAKSAGMNLAARIMQFADDVDLVRAVLLDPAEEGREAQRLVLSKLRPRFRSVYIDTGAVPDVRLGKPPHALPALTEATIAHLASGRQALRCVGASDGSEPVLAVTTRLGDEEGQRLVAEVSLDWLFDGEELRGSGAEVLVLDSRCEPLFESLDEPPELGDLRHAVSRSPASGTFEWQVRGETHLAHYWRLFMQPQFGADLLLVQSRARESVLAPLHGFQKLFSLTAIVALLLVTIVSMAQIRRTLRPIADLRAATVRVADGDLTTLVPAASRDEFGELAQSFNYMTAQLHDQITRRQQTELELLAARDEALAAARAKAEFLTNVSHELRTPLTSILVYAELLTSFATTDEEQRTEFMEVISEQASHLTNLIDKVLDLTMAGKWELRATDVGDTLKAATETLAAAQRHRIRLDLVTDLPRVPAAQDRLVQLWSHLIDNALKFSPPDSPVDVRVERREDQWVAVAIVDRGEGVAAADVARIFEPFCQVGHDIMTDKAGGVGLGLTLAKNIVERHGGRIEVKSAPGRGSTFVVLLPLAGAPAAEDRETAAAGQA